MKLVITEKPSVAMDISKVIGATEKKSGYNEGNGFLVSWCLGHLIELKMPEDYNPDLKKWDKNVLPIIPKKYECKLSESSKKQFYVLKKLMEDDRVDSIICATDAGREGELIFRLVYYAAKCSKPFERLWISSMTDNAIKKGFMALQPGRNYDDLYRAAFARSKADYCLGVNGTRLYTTVYNKLLKIGRVKSPTLMMVVNRENEIKNFVKEPFFIVHLIVDELGIDAKSEHLPDKDSANSMVERCRGKDGKIFYVKSEDKTLKPPKLYNLSDLQIDANKYFGYSASETLDTLQKLYETHKIVTYPRTDACFLTEDMEVPLLGLLDIMKENESFKKWSNFSIENIKSVLNSKKVSDHHALIPTENIKSFNLSTLKEMEINIFMLIAGRLICAVGEVQEYTTTQIKISVGDDVFNDSARVVKKNGWKDADNILRSVLGVKVKEKDKEKHFTRPLMEGDNLLYESNRYEVTEHETKPPSRYTEGELIKAMDKAGVKDLDKDAERQGLGTSATRAGIIAEIKQDGLFELEGKYLVPSDDAFKLATVLPEEMKSVDMTVDWENKLVQISKGQYSDELFMGEIENYVRYMIDNYKTPVKGITFENAGRTGFIDTHYLGECPKCGEKVLMGKFGSYCSGKCGVILNKAYGKALTDVQIKSILAGKKTLLKGLISQKGGSYDMYVKLKGIKPYSYTDKDGKLHDGYVLDYDTEFPEKK